MKLDTAFLKDSGDLAALLQVADVDDLDALVDYITDNGNGRVALSKDARERFVACKNTRNYRAADRGAIASEILLFGGNSVANLFRGGKGVSYNELAGDVGVHLKVTFAKGADARTIEEAIVAKLYSDAVAKMSSDELREFMANMGAFRAATGMAAGMSVYAMSMVVASAMASTVIGRGLPLAMSVIASRGAGVLLGPFGVALSGIWTVAELASAAYRVTVPCVVQIAHIRQKALQKALECRCSKCTKINTLEAKFCSECGNPMPQKTVPSTALATSSF
ncbi:ubiquinol-cytochrome C chaperone family protein [Paraburkholderia phenoliruptrix]|uniref:ubiquinol-cytochrome C chaperone family protein n=1 Tax=Paraburkholderia phenoliruptrix TaxID=252970 RepID=UPI001FC86CF0|nr:ubiquinol-cytochrome C chaperone family protein [Paraburkholderia phenoliruptrix]